MKGALKRCLPVAGWALLVAILLMGIGSGDAVLGQTDPLPSWNDGPSKQAIGKFVGAVTAAYSQKGGIKGRTDWADYRMNWNGPSFDGWTPKTRDTP